MDRQPLVCLDWAEVVRRFTDHIEDASQYGLTNRHHNRLTRIYDLGPPSQTVSWLHGDATDPVISEIVCHLERNHLAVVMNLKCGVDVWQTSLAKLDVNYRSDDLNNVSDTPAVVPIFQAIRSG